MGGKVYLACRRTGAAEEARQEIIQASHNDQVEVIQIDLSDYQSIRQCVEELNQREPNGIHVLINNAGFVTQHNDERVNGVMKIFAINQVGPFLLTNLLLPLLKKGAEQSGQNSRIVVLSSGACEAGKIDLDRIDSPHVSSLRAYANSKLANLMFTVELARQLSEKGWPITANAVHPGWVQTELDRNAWLIIRGLSFVASRLMAKTSGEGAETSLRLAVDPSLENVSGKYFEMCEESKAKHPMARDVSAHKRLWDECSKMSSYAPESQ